MSGFLAPSQLGYGNKLGAEATVHAARVHLQSIHPGNVFLKLDFRNAFQRNKMLAATDNLQQKFTPICTLPTAHPPPNSSEVTSSILLEFNREIPLGPLIFCLTIQFFDGIYKSEFHVFYLDDGDSGWFGIRCP